MSIVPFPKAVDTKKDNVFIVKKCQDKHDMFLKGFSFTCPSCKNKNEFNSNNMIFKTVEFFCHGCGTKYSVTNPAFCKKR